LPQTERERQRTCTGRRPTRAPSADARIFLGLRHLARITDARHGALRIIPIEGETLGERARRTRRLFVRGPLASDRGRIFALVVELLSIEAVETGILLRRAARRARTARLALRSSGRRRGGGERESHDLRRSVRR
jgi:hypothetical protein